MNHALLTRCRSLLAWVFLVSGSLSAQAQLTGGAPGGVNAVLAKLFGTNAAFTATIDARVLDPAGKPSVQMLMKFADLDGKLRVELDLTQVHSKDLNSKQLAAMEQAGLRNIISIVRPDKKCSYLLYPGVRNYSVVPMPKAETLALGKDLAIQTTVLGPETLDRHACLKHRVVLKNGDKLVLDAVTWNAKDLKDFPIQIQTAQGGNTSVMRFQEIRFVRPEAKLFEIPADYQENK